MGGVYNNSRCVSLSTFFEWVHNGVRMNDTEKGFLLDPLSAREVEILRLIEDGCTNREIAQKLTLLDPIIINKKLRL